MSKKKNKYDKSIDEYIEISKGDITLYTILSLIVIVVSLIAIIVNKLYTEPTILFFFLVICIIPSLRTVEKIKVKHNLLEIKDYLVTNNILDKIGKIEFYNEEDYFLTEKYMIIYRDKIVDCFEYNEIKSIQKTYSHKIGKNSESKNFLFIELKDDRRYEILTASTVLVNEDFRDISDDLLKKNPNIEVLEDSTKIKWSIFKM